MRLELEYRIHLILQDYRVSKHSSPLSSLGLHIASWVVRLLGRLRYKATWARSLLWSKSSFHIQGEDKDHCQLGHHYLVPSYQAFFWVQSSRRAWSPSFSLANSVQRACQASRLLLEGYPKVGVFQQSHLMHSWFVPCWGKDSLSLQHLTAGH